MVKEYDNEAKVTPNELLIFITDFFTKYHVVPNGGFLAGYYKTSRVSIYKKLDQLEQSGKIKYDGTSVYHRRGYSLVDNK